MTARDQYRDILVVAEAKDGKLRRCTLELLAKARELADRLGARVECLVAAEGAPGMAETAGHHGADRVLVADVAHDSVQGQPLLGPLARLAAARQYDIVLLSATDMGRDLAPMLAARLATGVANDCIDLDLDEAARLLVAKRPMYGERLVGSLVTPQSRPQIASLRPGAAREGFPDDSRSVAVERIEFALDGGPTLERIEPGGPPPLETADTIVVGGLGLADDAWDDLRRLARALNAGLGATRAAVQAGLAPPESQIGATGASVHPRLYISFGVSGAFEHLMGMHGADWIVAVDEDEDAHLLKRSDYALVGDAAAVLREMLAKLDGGR